jgi:ABC-type sugar transport system substrate-binding protein
MVDAMQAEAKKNPNVELSVQESANVEEQISKAQTMIAQGIKVIAIHPWEGNAILAFQKQYSGEGVKFFNLIDDVPGAVDSGYAVSFISGDERKGGELLGQWLTTQMDSGKIAVITGTPGELRRRLPHLRLQEGHRLQARPRGGRRVVRRLAA